jgi:hypothetical protein
MPDERFQLFWDEFETGTPAPPVDPADIRRMWELFTRLKAAAETSTHRGSVFLNAIADRVAWTPGANIGAVWVRTSLIEILHRTGVLKAWERGSDYEKRVFEVAAVYPMLIGEFDGEEFLRQVDVSGEL